MKRIDNNTFLLENCNHIVHYLVNELLKNDQVNFSTYERKHFLEDDKDNAIFKLFCKDDNYQKYVLDKTLSDMDKKINSIKTQI